MVVDVVVVEVVWRYKFLLWSSFIKAEKEASQERNCFNQLSNYKKNN